MEIQVYDCNDKIQNDSICQEHLLQFCRPFSILILGLSNCGKTNFIKNIIQQNDFSIIYVMHADPDSKDYEDTPHIKYEIGDDYIERFRQFAHLPKLLIIDDIDFRNLKKIQQNWFYKMLTYTRTHTNLSICSTVQDGIYYPPLIRRTFPIIVIFKYIELNSLHQSQAFNVLSKKLIKKVREKLMETDYDFIILNNKSKRSWICIRNKLQLLSDNNSIPYIDQTKQDDDTITDEQSVYSDLS